MSTERAFHRLSLIQIIIISHEPWQKSLLLLRRSRSFYCLRNRYRSLCSRSRRRNYVRLRSAALLYRLGNRSLRSRCRCLGYELGLRTCDRSYRSYRSGFAWRINLRILFLSLSYRFRITKEEFRNFRLSFYRSRCRSSRFFIRGNRRYRTCSGSGRCRRTDDGRILLRDDRGRRTESRGSVLCIIKTGSNNRLQSEIRNRRMESCRIILWKKSL